MSAKATVARIVEAEASIAYPPNAQTQSCWTNREVNESGILEADAAVAIATPNHHCQGEGEYSQKSGPAKSEHRINSCDELLL